MIAKILVTLLGFIAAAEAVEPPCRPFRVHLQADLPPPPPSSFGEDQSDQNQRIESCIAHYTSLDLNNNGIPDWSAGPKNMRSLVLYPNDDDLDGDGIPNVLDPKPLTFQSAPVAVAPNGVPAHLAMEGERGIVQGRIYRDFGILAIDHSDRHSLAVLQLLEKVLRDGFTAALRERIKSVKYVYAFYGHDAFADIAAYHRGAKAISIGGVRSYPDEEIAEALQIHIMASIAHEFGHAFLFDEIGPTELGRIAARFGLWHSVIGEKDLQSLIDDERVFRPHPLRVLMKLQETNHGIWKIANLVSEYAATNLHEWFADAFAAATMGRMAMRSLVKLPRQDTSKFWVNYENLTPEFREWFEHRVANVNRSAP